MSVKLNVVSEQEVHSQELARYLPEAKKDELLTIFLSTLLPISTRDSHEAEGARNHLLCEAGAYAGDMP